MENNRPDSKFEIDRLARTVSLAESQLEQARLDNENNAEAIIEAKREMRENAAHSVSGLWSSEGFEDLVALSQYVNPIMNKIAEYETTENRIAVLERLVESPYFARIDFKFDGEDTFEKVYIGRASLTDGDSLEMYVYDWRAPIAGMFYRFTAGPAFYEAPAGKMTGEINLKRQYEIKNGTLEYFFDADVQIVDEFLRKLLSQNASSKMKAIVETIQKEQDVVIRDMENELMMVQGAAGSGKTSVALHRAAYLMYQGFSSPLSANNIMIISPNALFERYISSVLPELGESNVVSAVFEEILGVILKNDHIQAATGFLEIMLTNPRYKNTMKSSLEFKTSRQFSALLDRFIDDLPHSLLDFDDVRYGEYYVARKEELKNKVLSGRRTTPLGLRLEQLEDFILETVKEAHKQHGDRTEYSRIRKEIKKFTEPDIEYLYGRLFDGEEYFYSLAEGLELPENIPEILRFTSENLRIKKLYYDDASALAFLKLKINRTSEYKNIRQVVIDEAQDYYPLHYEIFNLLFPSAKYTVLGDINQTLGKSEDLSLYERIKEILNKPKSTLVTMDKSYRCTNEILAFSAKLLPPGPEIKSFNREGRPPDVRMAADAASLREMLVSEAELCLKEGYRSVGLICKTEKNVLALFKSLKGRLDVRVIKKETAEVLSGIFIIPVYLSKGLEFDAVLICDADGVNYSSEDDRRLLYIACTRALHRLSLFGTGERCPLL